MHSNTIPLDVAESGYSNVLWGNEVEMHADGIAYN